MRFDRFNLPIRIHHLNMVEGRSYRGMHSHMAIEIVAVKSGILHCCVNDDTIQIHPNQIVFINSNTGHRLYSENAQITYIHFDAGLLEGNENDDARSKIYAFVSHKKAKAYMVFDNNEEITRLLQKLYVRYSDTAGENRWYLKASLYELVGFMCAKAFITPSTISKEQLKKIDKTVRYIDANYTSTITLEDICNAAEYNKYTICHTFKTVTGSTIFEYINFLRVHCAVEMLRKNESSILEVATECGFSSVTYFNRVFKSFFGCAPSVYRKLLAEK